MSRPITSGTHTVPKEVSALKPKNIPCDIKVVLTQSKDSGFHKHYYVYESARTGSGKIIGKIEVSSVLTKDTSLFFRKMMEKRKPLIRII